MVFNLSALKALKKVIAQNMSGKLLQFIKNPLKLQNFSPIQLLSFTACYTADNNLYIHGCFNH